MVSPLRYGLFRVLFVFECLLFTGVYMFGGQGLREIWHQHAENVSFARENTLIGQQIVQLEHEIDAWEHNALVKERLARETLNMARSQDTVYYWS